MVLQDLPRGGRSHMWWGTTKAELIAKLFVCVCVCFFLHLHEIVEGLYLIVCVCVCVSVCLSVCPIFLVNKIPPNGCTDLDAVLAKWLLTALARTLLNLVTLGQRSRSQ